MKGSYRIRVSNQKLHYDFVINRNITVIRGDSATGKTTLVEMIREYYENGRDSGIELSCPIACGVLEGRNWNVQLTAFRNSILFIDEGNRFVTSKEFAESVQKSDNYFVIIARESLPMLPYSVEEIYGIRNSGKYGGLKRTYNEMYHIFGKETWKVPVYPSIIITEDSNSGYQFFDRALSSTGIRCMSANGKSNLFSVVSRQGEGTILVIADGAAIGSEMERLYQMLKWKPDVHLFLPESFEWVILKSGVISNREIAEILKNPSEYIDSQKYFSWERFFTDLIVKSTQGTYLAYKKRELNAAYLNENVADKILSSIENIEFHHKKDEINED